MAGRRQTTLEQEAAMRAGFLGGRSGSQIHREMQVNGLLTHPHPNVTIRLVQSRLREMQQMTPPDESGPWSVIDADPEDARRVLDVAAYLADVTDGRLWLTRELAGWVSRDTAGIARRAAGLGVCARQGVPHPQQAATETARCPPARYCARRGAVAERRTGVMVSRARAAE